MSFKDQNSAEGTLDQFMLFTENACMVTDWSELCLAVLWLPRLRYFACLLQVHDLKGKHFLMLLRKFPGAVPGGLRPL